MVKFFLRATSYSTSYDQAGIMLNRFQFMVKGHVGNLIIKNIFIIKIRSAKSLYIVISADLGSRFCIFRRSPRVLLIFRDAIFRYSSNINLQSSITIFSILYLEPLIFFWAQPEDCSERFLLVHMQALRKKLKLVGATMNSFLKTLLGN